MPAPVLRVRWSVNHIKKFEDDLLSGCERGRSGRRGDEHLLFEDVALEHVGVEVFADLRGADRGGGEIPQETP